MIGYHGNCFCVSAAGAVGAVGTVSAVGPVALTVCKSPSESVHCT